MHPPRKQRAGGEGKPEQGEENFNERGGKQKRKWIIKDYTSHMLTELNIIRNVPLLFKK